MGNAARLLTSWLDGILEFTILKHEVIVLRLKNNKVIEQIRNISQQWPRKKEFIEGAYKLLLFTKSQRRQVNLALNHLRDNCPQQIEARLPAAERRKRTLEPDDKKSPLVHDGDLVDYRFMDYTEALNKVVRRWYE